MKLRPSERMRDNYSHRDVICLDSVPEPGGLLDWKVRKMVDALLEAIRLRGSGES